METNLYWLRTHEHCLLCVMQLRWIIVLPDHKLETVNEHFISHLPHLIFWLWPWVVNIQHCCVSVSLATKTEILKKILKGKFITFREGIQKD